MTPRGSARSVRKTLEGDPGPERSTFTDARAVRSPLHGTARPIRAPLEGSVSASEARLPVSGPAAERPAPTHALTGAANRPDPVRGVFSTILARDGVAVDADAHVARLERSVRELYGQALPEDLDERIAAAAAGHACQRLRVLVAPGGGPRAAVELDGRPLDGGPRPEPALLAPAYLPGGLGSHKWRDRRLLEELEHRAGALPLIVDLDDEVLEAATANVWIVEETTLVTPPLDGRLLPGTTRERVLAAAPSVGLEPREEPIVLERLAAADEVLLSSAIHGVRPAALAGAAPFEAGARLRRALHEPPLVEAG
jgi:para-aminobenzoate synthetase / 4-amino-4-deoxychorismate lyase